MLRKKGAAGLPKELIDCGSLRFDAEAGLPLSMSAYRR
jgi:hypothetical protein